MLVSFPASVVNQIPFHLGIPNRFKLDTSRSSGGATPRSFLAVGATNDFEHEQQMAASMIRRPHVAAPRRERCRWTLPGPSNRRNGGKITTSLYGEIRRTWGYLT